MAVPYRTYILVSIILLQVNVLMSQRADFDVPENQLNRRFSWSREALIMNAINDLAPDAIPFIDFITSHAARVERAVLESLKRKKSVPQDIIQPCSPHINKKYRSSVSRGFALQGYLEPAWNCGTDVSGVQMKHGEDPGYTLHDLYEAMFNEGLAIKRRVNEIAARVIRNASSPDFVFNFRYSTVSANCVLNMACLSRQGKYWHKSIGISTHQKEDYLRDGSRSSVWENLRVVHDKLGDPLLMRLPIYDNGSIERVISENTTTMIQTWRGQQNPSCFRLIPVEDNPAIVRALDLADHSFQLVEDALSPSNLAILVLPLTLNLVPLALFADVETMSLLFYTILSDVLTVVPLAIKGVELYLIDRKNFRSVVTRMMSHALGNSTKPISAAGEMWGAECRVREGVRRTGIILIIISMVFLCIGVAGELVARKYVRSRRKVIPNWKWSPENQLVNLVSKTSSGERSISNRTVETGDIGPRYSSDLERHPDPEENIHYWELQKNED